ncbi:polynucleotide adenylyltransferase PcnB [Halotalea alkalilenta]|uniref:polynucleotide adenylyltransferase PcnB n=1 Tax=Halotalea alkalilenta TaxID=376489 RepID=UPI000693936F|nr:polynucleotide adenylyltransferase PcnB [Halotalea alkalilenta]
MKTPVGDQASLSAPRILPRDEHSLSRGMLSENALKVLYRLNKAGFQAYLVGGCVRDGLLGITPKDFDVATDATPDEVKALFRNAMIIGRRFRIVHVRFGREIIEVTTFRGQHDDEDDVSRAHRSATGMLLRDNVWGSIDEDALRRDFTVNALYYSVADFSIYDWTGGIDDLERRQLKLIGDPEVRYREDPVRMLRAIRFAGKLGFKIEERTAAPIIDLAPLLLSIPPARLFEEVLKLFLNGAALETYRGLREHGLFAMLFPVTFDALSVMPWAETMIEQALVNTDQRILEGKPVTPAFLYAALLWPAVVMDANALEEEGMPPALAHQQAAQQVISRQLQHTSIPKRFSFPMRDIWELQLRLPRRKGKRADQVMSHPRFRAGYDFLLLRESAGELAAGLGEWWTRYQTLEDAERRGMISQIVHEPAGLDEPLPETASKPTRSRRRPRRRPPRGE